MSVSPGGRLDTAPGGNNPIPPHPAAMTLPAPWGAEQQLEEMMELTAQNLPRLEVTQSYTILRELGSGSYGHVLLAVHQRQGRPMALKFIEKRDTELRDFLSEYCISLSLAAHPCIASALGIAFQTEHHYVFAQELAPARDLFSLLQPQVGFGLAELHVKRCALQLASALEFMGAKGLVHRDVKPENVLLLDLECRRVKLTDFGLSCPQGTAIEALPENLPYTAPELCLLGPSARLPAQPSLDAWALGVLLFCVLTGFFPWHTAADRHYRDFERWHRSPRIRPRPPRWGRFTYEAQEMLRGLLTPDPSQRSPASIAMAHIKCPWLEPKEPGTVHGGRTLRGSSHCR
ncbi:serine/threonine-protein kinase SBK2-like isoform X1 [Natator depressus]|uniref:serine/threonine-protein kinase SBK2-like isoform X1 n=2 Tax=Natator depressus TaxID=27790 RepID=UPI003EB85213